MRPTMNQWFFVRPMEALYFGPPRPFDAGEAHHGRSLFPPAPTTFQGMIRSRLLAAVEPPLDLNDWATSARAEREKLVGLPDALPPGWQITGPLLVETGRYRDPVEDDDELVTVPWVATPRFLLDGTGRGGGPPRPVHARVIESGHPGKNDLGKVYLMGRPEANGLSSLGGWIDPHNLELALKGENGTRWSSKGFGKELPAFVKRERRPGLAIDRGDGGEEPVDSQFGKACGDRGAAAEGMLYFLEMLRFRDGSGMAGHLAATGMDGRIPADALTSGLGITGRHARYVAFEALPPFHPTWRKLMTGEYLPDEVPEKTLFWLVAMAPVRVIAPLRPEVRADLPAGVRIEFKAALTGSALVIGGHQLATGRSRPNRPFLPAGSCWLIELEGADPATRGVALRALHNRHILGPAEDAPFGYGHTLVGIGPSNARR